MRIFKSRIEVASKRSNWATCPTPSFYSNWDHDQEKYRFYRRLKKIGYTYVSQNRPNWFIRPLWLISAGVILFSSISYGQTVSLVVDGIPFPNEPIDSVEHVLTEQLIHRGFFGGNMVLVENDHHRLIYDFSYDSKMIDSILFDSSIPINDDILEKIFSPLYRIDQSNSIQPFGQQLQAGFSFIPKDLNIMIGRTEIDQLGAFVDFTPDFNSHFSGIIGAVQNDNKKWTYSGEIEMRLENTWRTASATDIIWKRQNEKSQYTRVMHEEPYPFRLPFGVKIEYIQDFRDGNYVLNKMYGAFSVVNIAGKWYLGGNAETLSPTQKGKSIGINSFRSESFTIALTSDNRNNRWLPTQGTYLDVSTEVGKIYKKGSTFRFEMLFEKLVSLSNHLSIQMKIRNNAVHNSGGIENVHDGQMFKYGGHNSLRGYQEDIFKDDLVSIFNGNILFIPNHNIQLYPFVDLAFNYQSPFKYSRGFGFRQRTNNSILEISFGWPRDEAFAAGKVHVKFISLLD
ncbi:MAG: BamA/TamA family outer membrane protein [Fidelibacterota bacterium]